MYKSAVILMLGLVAFATTVSADEERISFPADYKTAFTHYYSGDRTMDPGQVIRMYANDVALTAAKAGRDLPNGSILVAEVYKAKMGEDGKAVTSSLNRQIIDKLAAVAVMQKGEGWGDAFPENLRNGDWDFAIFSPDRERLVKKDLNTCRSCHAPLESRDFVFSWEHLTHQLSVK